MGNCNRIFSLLSGQRYTSDETVDVENINSPSALGLALLECSDKQRGVVSKYSSYTDDRVSHIIHRTNIHRCSLLQQLLIDAEKHHPDSWEELFGSNKCCLNWQNSEGNSILHFACMYDLERSVGQLLQLGVDLTLSDKDGNQPLHLAITHSSANIVKQLLNCGANVFIKNKNGNTPLQIAVKIKRPDVFLKLVTQLEPHKTHNPLCVAITTETDYSLGIYSVYTRDKNLLENLLHYVTTKSCYCKGHEMPLLSIALQRSPDYAPFSYEPDDTLPIKINQVKILLKHGIHPNCTTDHHQSTNIIPQSQRKLLPINMAVESMLVTVRVLLQHGAYVNFSSVSSGDIAEDTPHIMIMKKVPKLFEPIGPDWSYWPDEYKPSSYKCILKDFISAGAKMSKTSVNMKDLINFEKGICDKKEEIKMVKYMLESGYRFTVDLTLSLELQKINSEPYSLQCLTAQKIRICLMPNAWVGVKQLSLPTRLKKYVVMNSSYVDL